MIETNFDNFSKNNHISSELIFGNPQCKFHEDISICIPTFKRSSLLYETIQSALNQKTNIKFKVIVVDDESCFGDTETSKMLSFFSDERLIYYKNNKNLGLFGNINRCIQLAQTKYVSLLHDDDLLKSNYIEKITDYLNHKKDIDCLCVSFDHLNFPFNSNNEKLKSISFKFKILKLFFQNKMLRIPDADNYFLHRNVFGPPTCGQVFNKEICLLSGGWNEKYYPTADWIYMINFNKNYKVYRIPDILAIYRWESNTSLKSDVMLQFYKHSNEVVEKYKTKYRFFYNEIINQILNDHEKYNVKFNNKVNFKYSKIKMHILILIQRILNLRYIKF